VSQGHIELRRVQPLKTLHQDSYPNPDSLALVAAIPQTPSGLCWVLLESWAYTMIAIRLQLPLASSTVEIILRCGQMKPSELTRVFDSTSHAGSFRARSLLRVA
jgi:hypothetical protein